MKKILGVTLVLLLCLGMGGCTKQEAVEPTPTETGTVATTTQEKPEPTKTRTCENTIKSWLITTI